MSMFELDFELSGLKVRIKSDREDAPKAINAVQQQIGGLLQTAAGLGDAEMRAVATPTLPSSRTIEASVTPALSTDVRAKGNKGKRNRTAVSTPPVVYAHSEALGLPKQNWNTAQKALWLLNILERATERNEYSTGELASTFNKDFKQFGPVTTTNVTRDLGKMRVRGFVSTNSTKDPQAWFLLEDGKKEVARLTSEAVTPKA